MPIKGLIATNVVYPSGVPSIGGRIKHLREMRGWSQRQLADLSGVDKQTIYEIETGRTKRPHAETLQKLHKVFGTELTKGYPAVPPLEDSTNAPNSTGLEDLFFHLMSYIRPLAGLRRRQTLNAIRAYLDAIDQDEIGGAALAGSEDGR